MTIDRTHPPDSPSGVVISALFCATVFVGAMLLFLVEPFAGKTLLPRYGGTPAVWNTCVFFFQLELLVGYAAVYLGLQYLSTRSQLLAIAAVALASTATLPVRLPVIAANSLTEHPVASLVYVLSLAIGCPFFVLSVTAPVSQLWYARLLPQSNPYWLYIASNAGSLAALIAYPALVEDRLTLVNQSEYWSYAFVGFVCLFLTCGLLTHFRLAEHSASGGRIGSDCLPTIHEAGITGGTRLRWLLYSMCPSSLLLGVTLYLSSEIAPIPLLWVLPLSIYLVSFMVAFADPPNWLIRFCEFGYFVAAAAVSILAYLQYQADLLCVCSHLALLLSGTVALHCQLARCRPGVSHLAEYYLWIAVGGLAGGVFNSLIAPSIFDWLAEYPCAIALGLVLIPCPWPAAAAHRRVRLAIQCTAVALVLTGLSWNVYLSRSSTNVMYRDRTFYGTFSVIQGTGGLTHKLAHGTTNHGTQNFGGPSRGRRAPLTYYFWNGPIGDVFIAYRHSELAKSVGIVGLGVGSLAGYADAGQSYTFYEIDPAIERVARNPKWFTFLVDAKARGVAVNVVTGDARLRMVDARDQEFGILILDAFTSDAIPVHLLTKEAVALYSSKMKPGGVLAFHISNIYIDLEPILANIASDLNLVALIREDKSVAAEDARLGKVPSAWVVMAHSANSLKPLVAGGKWRPCRAKAETGVWTDGKSNVLRAIRW